MGFWGISILWEPYRLTLQNTLLTLGCPNGSGLRDRSAMRVINRRESNALASLLSHASITALPSPTLGTEYAPHVGTGPGPGGPGPGPLVGLGLPNGPGLGDRSATRVINRRESYALASNRLPHVILPHSHFTTILTRLPSPLIYRIRSSRGAAPMGLVRETGVRCAL